MKSNGGRNVRLSTILYYGSAILVFISTLLIFINPGFLLVTFVAVACAWYGFYLRGRGE